MIDSKVLDILACPSCKGDVEYNAKDEIIKCTACAKEYKVINGIPMMMIEDPVEEPAEDENDPLSGK